MKPLKPLGEQTIVIMGASSGIGRATAITAAKRGARVVVSARNAEALAELEEEIRRTGGQALAVPADVTDEEQVRTVAARAAATFKGIDTWVNNAGVSVYGDTRAVSLEDARRVIEINYFGQLIGARVALPYLERQGRGALICTGSVLSDRAVPMQGVYCASKHAVKALTETLRVELAHDGSKVQVTLIKPSSMNTPFFDSARTYMGRRPKPIAPVYDPQLVADAILYAAEHRTRDLTVGGGGKGFLMLEAFAGPLIDAYLSRAGERSQQADEPKGADAPHNLVGPIAGPRRVHGSFGGRGVSLYTWGQLHPRAALLAGSAAAAVAGSWAALRSRR